LTTSTEENVIRFHDVPRRGVNTLLAAALMLCACAAHAQNFPAKPLRIVVPFAPGGPNDILARTVGQKMTENWGQQVIVDNRPGAGTVIGTQLVARAPADGYTLLMVATSMAVNPSLRAKLPYDTMNDFTPVTLLIFSPNVLVTHPSVPVASVKDLIALARSRPGQISYASGGTGAATHLAGELLAMEGRVKMIHVPYKGAAPATVDLLSGQVSWMFGTILPTIPHIKAAKLRAIAVTSPKRTAVLPDVPAVAETLAGFDATSWYGLFAPAGTPKDVIARLHAENARIINLPEIRERLLAEGAAPAALGPDEFAAHFRREVEKWGKVVRTAGIKPE
jgi:tripartite-type tricarboxylate transporter receptor subunit TctC